VDRERDVNVRLDATLVEFDAVLRRNVYTAQISHRSAVAIVTIIFNTLACIDPKG